MAMTLPVQSPATPAWAAALVRGPVDLRRLWATLRRYRVVFALVFLLVFLGALLHAMTATPVYTAVSSVMIDDRHHNVTPDQQQVLSDLPDATGVVDTEVEIMRSRALAGRVVDALNLTADPEFNKALRKHGFSLFGRAKPPPAGEDEHRRERDATIDGLIKRIQVDRRGLTYVINIAVTSVSPAKAAVLANTVADRYLTAQLDAKFEATQRANRWLQGRLGALRSDVTTAEQSVASYQSSKGLLQATGSNLSEQRVAQLQASESSASADLAEKQARLNTARQQIAAGGTGQDLGEALNSEVIKTLRGKLSDAIHQQQLLSAKYGPRHPDVIAQENTQHQIETDIQAEVNRIVGSLQADVNASSQRLAAIRADLGQAQGTLASSKSAEVGMNSLQMNADAQSAVYKSLLDRFQQTSVQDGSLQSDAQVVSPAQIPLKPSSPNKPLDIGLGLVFGVLAGIVTVVGMEMWSGEVRTSDDVEKMLNVPSIGSVPTTKGATNQPPAQYLVDTPLSAFAESFRQLRAALRRADLDSPVKTLAVTSALPGEGKSTTSMCLARSIALGGQKTIAVDCDLRRRTLHTMLAIKPAVGLLEVLAGTAKLADAIIIDEPSGCHILPLTASKFTPRDVFGTQAFAKLVAQLKADYDMVILDCAPVLAVADTRTITEVVDGVLLLVQWQKTAARAVKYAITAVESVGGKVLGVALTKVNLKAQAAYGYGDSGYYFRSYANYYVEQ